MSLWQIPCEPIITIITLWSVFADIIKLQHATQPGVTEPHLIYSSLGLQLSSPRLPTNKEVLGHCYVPITRSENSDEWRERGDTWTGKTRINTNLGSDFIYICECVLPRDIVTMLPGVFRCNSSFGAFCQEFCDCLQTAVAAVVSVPGHWSGIRMDCDVRPLSLRHSPLPSPPLPANPGSGPTINLSPASLNWVRCLRWGSVSHRMFIFVVELNELTRLSQPLIYCHRSKGCSHITLSRA